VTLAHALNLINGTAISDSLGARPIGSPKLWKARRTTRKWSKNLLFGAEPSADGE